MAGRQTQTWRVIATAMVCAAVSVAAISRANAQTPPQPNDSAPYSPFHLSRLGADAAPTIKRLPVVEVSRSQQRIAAQPSSLQATLPAGLPAPELGPLPQPLPASSNTNWEAPTLGNIAMSRLVAPAYPADIQGEVPCEDGCNSCSPCNSRTYVPLDLTCRVNQSSLASCWLAEYFQRANEGCPDPVITTGTDVAYNYSSWWDHLLSQPAGLAQQPRSISVDELIQSALIHSPHIQVAATEPHIRQTVMIEEDAGFDWRAFLDTQYDDLNDPIGNTLTTGNNENRFKQREWYGQFGVKRRNRLGGEFDISQRIGTFTNNSRFLVPPNQGNTRLELNYTQPLLNGGGRFVNESLVLLARLDYEASGDELVQSIQDHLLRVTEAYWELYRARAAYLQRQKLLRGAESILENLQGRAKVDSLDRQILRATAAVASRKSEISRARTSIRNAESQLRLLVNDPAMMNSSCFEFLPNDRPVPQPLDTTCGQAVTTALTHRADISQAIRELRAAMVRLGVSRNDLLPKLDLLLQSYVAGLDAGADIMGAFTREFNDGRPAFSVGLQFEVPIYNRAAKARLDRRQWECTRAIGQFRSVAETVVTDVEVALREVSTTHQEMDARYEAMQASSQETEYLVDRWRTLPNIDDSATLLLEDLLDSQERMADEEGLFVEAQVKYSVALVRLRQAMGTLLLSERQ